MTSSVIFFPSGSFSLSLSPSYKQGIYINLTGTPLTCSSILTQGADFEIHTLDLDLSLSDFLKVFINFTMGTNSSSFVMLL